MNKNDLITLEQFKEKHYGKVGTPKRDKLESGYQNFKIGVLLQQARIEKGLTQEELAVKVGASKSYISKIENSTTDARFTTILKVFEALEAKVNFNVEINERQFAC
jgi:DNA-binding XRE family transcriptional regulator